MTRTLTVEGDLASADTRINLTTQGSVTAPSLVVPSGVTKIDKIIVSASSEGLADGSSSFLLRLGGTAILRGEQNIVISSSGRKAPQSGSDSAPQTGWLFVLDDADIEVNPSDTVTIAGEMMGDDTGTGHMVVTVVFA
jgi:hypothetical protein